MSFYHDNDFADRCAASVRRRVAVRFFLFFFLGLGQGC